MERFMKNENILYVNRVILGKMIDLSKEIFPIDIDALNRLPFDFVLRASAETDESKKQLIPYVLLRNAEGKILSYRRCGSEKRLSQMVSVGIGGHVNDGDLKSSLYETLVSGVCREIKEEIGIDVEPAQLKLLGLINEEQTEVGHVHTGVVFMLLVKGDELDFDSEIGSPEWIVPETLDFEKAELWSSLALKLYLGR